MGNWVAPYKILKYLLDVVLKEWSYGNFCL